MMKLSIGVFIGVWILIVYAVSAHIVNAVKFVKLDFQTPVKAEVIRGIGLVTPLSFVIGYMKIEDK